ncbi:MAG: alpha/beta fold hydrolase [Actinobacteria bacterium]|nr:alpha/beta fold hydrolase [Actinomycetota bacterium]
MAANDLNTTMRDRVLDGLGLEQRRLRVDGVVTSVLEGGQGPPLVLLHGAIQAGGLIWWRAVPRLAEHHRLIIPDAPGLGESEPAAGPLEPATVVRWLSELLELTCDEEPALVAHSAPGGLATRFAVEHDSRLRRLVLVDAAGLGPFRPPPGLLFALLGSTARPSPRSFERLMGHVVHDLDVVRRDEGDRWEALADYAVSRAAVPSVKQAMRQLPRSGTRRIPEAALHDLAVPTALVWGRHDRLVPLAIAEAAQARLGWPLHVIEGAGHLPHVEQPDGFVDAVTAAIGRQ